LKIPLAFPIKPDIIPTISTVKKATEYPCTPYRESRHRLEAAYGENKGNDSARAEAETPAANPAAPEKG
jgi:hypothetical protein